MGVDFFPCSRCCESICDCGSYVRCECGYKWCSDACAKEDGFNNGWDEELDEDVEPSCKYCRDEDLDDSTLLKFVLKHAKLTRKKALKLYFDRKKPKK